ncbi:hypothetical protein [Streptomyces sp. NBC_00391]|uniref:hypothetical protein n=1 Tax=Streptomyces sp. NBC_00391 TaxID=2903647 RepID=UPI002E1A8722
MIAWFAWAGYVLGYAALVAGAVALDGRVRTKAVAEALARYEAAKPDPADAVPDDDLRLGIAGVAVLVQGGGGTHRAFWTVIIDMVARGVLEPGTTYDGKPTLRCVEAQSRGLRLLLLARPDRPGAWRHVEGRPPRGR